MTDCERFEIAIERRRAGALDDGEARLLDAHVASCASCRGFEAVVHDTDASLRGEIIVGAENIPWNEVRERAVSGAREETRKRILIKAVVLALMVALVFVSTDAGRRASTALAAGAVGLAVIVLVARRSSSDTADLGEAPQGAFFYVYQRQLRRRLRALWLAIAIAPVVMVWACWAQLRAPASSPGNAVVCLAGALIVAGSIVHALVVSRPRIQRELDALAGRK